MIRRMARMFLGSALLLIGGAASLAQDTPKFKVGDIVEAHSFFFTPPWHKAKVVNVGRDCESYLPYKPYHVVFIEPEEDHGLACVGNDEIRAIEAEKPSADADKTVNQNNPRPVGNGTFRVGDRVDVFAKRRGTIIEAANGRYKIHYDGCEKHWDDWRDRAELRPEATISADAPEIKFLVGKWVMFTPSYPTTVVRGNNVYREYGMGAKAPPLQINADGTYVWYFDFGKPPVKGKWRTDARVEGEKYTAAAEVGIVIKDPSGGEWKVFRRQSTMDKEDHITAQTMCSGQTVIGTRIR